MTPEIIIDIFKHTVSLIIMFICILIIPGLITGFIVSVFQAATQINEQTLSFVPKLLITFATLIIAAPWLIKMLIDFYGYIMERILSLAP
jgi:flagellar biosynthetic protein FliQ